MNSGFQIFSDKECCSQSFKKNDESSFDLQPNLLVFTDNNGYLTSTPSEFAVVNTLIPLTTGNIGDFLMPFNTSYSKNLNIDNYIEGYMSDHIVCDFNPGMFSISVTGATEQVNINDNPNGPSFTNGYIGFISNYKPTGITLKSNYDVLFNNTRIINLDGNTSCQILKVAQNQWFVV